MGLQLTLFLGEMDEGKERRVSPKELKMFNTGVAVAQKSLKAAVAQLHNGGKGFRGISRKDHDHEIKSRRIGVTVCGKSSAGTPSDVSDCFP